MSLATTLVRAPERRALAYTGLVGVALSAVCVVGMLFHGDTVGAEGHLLHAAGFHALQAVPVIAIVAKWAACPNAVARRAVHYGGPGWQVTVSPAEPVHW